MPNQLALFATNEVVFKSGHVTSVPPYPAEPSAIICSVSGGVDSDACAVWARLRWPNARIILFHAHLAEMDWPQTPAHLDALAATLGNCERVTLQAVYELTGEPTPSGYRATRLRRVHDVQAHGPATDSDPNAILTLTAFWEHARLGMPPTLGKRWCTDYFKQTLFETWCRANRLVLGSSAVLLSGERWRESDNRARVNSWEWRAEVALKPTKRAPDGWNLLWARPVIDQTLAQVATLVTDAGVELHPGYFIQGETIEAMRDPARAEAGRARLSCVTCIFTQPRHLKTALGRARALIQPYIDRVQAIEGRVGKTWQQSGELLREQASERVRDR